MGSDQLVPLPMARHDWYDPPMRPTQRHAHRQNTHATHHADGLRQVIDARELFWNNVIRDILMSISVMKIQQTEAIRVAMEQSKAQATVKAQTASDGCGTTITGPYVGKKGGKGPGGGVGGGGDRGPVVGSIGDVGGNGEGEGQDGQEDEDGDEGDGVMGPITLSGLPPFDGRLAIVTVQGVRIAIADVFPLFACSIEGSDVARELSADVQCTVFQIRTPQGEVFTLPVHEIRSFHSLSEELMAQIEAASARTNSAGTKTTVPFGFGAFTSLARSAETDARDEAEDGQSPEGRGG